MNNGLLSRFSMLVVIAAGIVAFFMGLVNFAFWLMILLLFLLTGKRDEVKPESASIKERLQLELT